MGIKDRLKNSIGNFRENLQQKKEIRNAKKDALKLFTLRDLKRLCDEAGIGHPPRYSTDPLTGEKIKNKMDKKQYMGYIVKKESLEFIERFAEKHRISIPPEIFERPARVSREKKTVAIPPTNKEEKTIEETEETDTNLEDLLNYIKNDFQNYLNGIRVRDEEEFNNILYSNLSEVFKGRMTVENKSKLHKEADIRVGGKYFLELKYAKYTSTLDRGIKELFDYQKRGVEHPIMVILDINANWQIDEYVKTYEEHGAYVIKLRGNGY